MAGLYTVFLLVAACAPCLGDNAASSPHTWSPSKWMHESGQQTMCGKHTAAVQQLANKMQELQVTCSTGKEAQIAAQYEQKLKEMTEIFEQEREIWKLKLQNAELLAKDESRRQVESDCALRCSESTLRIETRLDTCRNDTLVYVRDLATCQTKSSAYEAIKDELNLKLASERDINAAVTRETAVLKEDISLCTTESRHKTKIILDMQKDLDKSRNASETLVENVSKLSALVNVSNTLHLEDINRLTTELQTERNSGNLINISLDLCYTNLNKFKSETESVKTTLASCNTYLTESTAKIETLNMTLQSCKSDLVGKVAEVELLNTTQLGLQSSLSECGRTSEDRRTKLEECARNASAAQTPHQSAVAALESQLQKERHIALRDQLVRESNGKVFNIGSEEKVIIMKYINWQPATDICTSIGMKMVSLQTAEKWRALKTYLTANGLAETWFWTSGRKVDGAWTWTATGERVFYTDWRSGQGHDSGDVCIRFKISTGGWSDGSCSGDTNNIICE